MRINFTDKPHKIYCLKPARCSQTTFLTKNSPEDLLNDSSNKPLAIYYDLLVFMQIFLYPFLHCDLYDLFEITAQKS